MEISSKPHRVFAIIKAVSVPRQDNTTHDLNKIRNAIQTLINLTLHEPGCLGFDVLESVDVAGVFYLWETWQSPEALEEHYEMEYTQDYFKQAYTELIDFKILQSIELQGQI